MIRRRRRLRRRRTNERGESLIELLVALSIMSIALIAVVSGLATSILMSGIHRKQTSAGAAVRSYAEAVEKAVAGTGYTACAVAGASSPYKASNVGFAAPDLPAGYSTSVDAVQYWSDAAKSFGGSCVTDAGVQKVSLSVSSTDGRVTERLDVVIRRPCGPGSTCT